MTLTPSGTGSCSSATPATSTLGISPVVAGDVRTDGIVDVYRNSGPFGDFGTAANSRAMRGLRVPTRLWRESVSCYAMTGGPLASDSLCAYVPEDWDGKTGKPDITDD